MVFKGARYVQPETKNPENSGKLLVAGKPIFLQDNLISLRHQFLNHSKSGKNFNLAKEANSYVEKVAGKGDYQFIGR